MLKEFVTPKSILTSFRSLLSTFCAVNGSHFTEFFLKHNSGTYNNDYYIIDMNKFERGVKPSKDLVWLVEQIPSTKQYRLDMTDYLVHNGFISSFNCPFLDEVFNLLKYPDHSHEPIFYYNYTKNPRYQISARDAPGIKTYEKFLKFMRFNDYKRDPYSGGNPGLAISARFDLLDNRTEGSINAKSIKGSRAMTDMVVDIISSPCHDELPIFSWDNPPFQNIPHDGLPTRFDFGWVTMNNSNHFNGCEKLHESECIVSSFCGWCGRSNKCMAGDDEGPWNGNKCVAGWKAKYTSHKTYIIALIAIFAIVVIGSIIMSFCFYNPEKSKSILSNMSVDKLIENRDW